MRLLTAATLLAITVSALAAVTPLSPVSVEKYKGATTGRYIVQLRDGADRTSLTSQILAAKGQITHEWDIINGFAGTFDASVLNIVLTSPQVERVTEDGIMSISNDIQSNAPWGLYRISNRSPLAPGSSPASLTYNYVYPSNPPGYCVDIYIVDTGIRVTHSTFQGRARWGATFGGYPSADGHGHGTHVAGTTAGLEYGVAKAANVIAVKVLSDEGSGSVADIISGLDFVLKEKRRTNRPSVVNMSLGGFAQQSLDDAVKKLTDGGVHVAVAAGNSGAPAELYSPARAPSAVTVAASDIADKRPSWSNFGTPVDIFAPGVDVVSAWSTSDTDTKMISGTSMATPHIAGLIAYIAAAEGDRSPADMVKKLQEYAIPDAISDASLPPMVLTNNLLAQNRRTL